jgi:hypothetical protein
MRCRRLLPRGSPNPRLNLLIWLPRSRPFAPPVQAHSLQCAAKPHLHTNPRIATLRTSIGLKDFRIYTAAVKPCRYCRGCLPGPDRLADRQALRLPRPPLHLALAHGHAPHLLSCCWHLQGQDHSSLQESWNGSLQSEEFCAHACAVPWAVND